MPPRPVEPPTGPTVNRLLLGYRLLGTLGPAWVAGRAWQALKHRAGWLQRRFPATPWEARPLSEFLLDPALATPEAYLEYRRKAQPPFFFDAASQRAWQPRFAQWDQGGSGPINRAREVSGGWLQYFSHERLQSGFPPDWHRNQRTGQTAPRDGHWSRLNEFAYGDVKVIWEPNRFAFTYDLARAYWRAGDEQFPETFWRLLEDWRQQNPPQAGINWRCGQEVAFRLMAWCFGLYAFGRSAASTPARVSALAQMAAVSADRIAGHISYALSQRNNHGVSEAVGLWTSGRLFPEFRQSERWRRTGQRLLERLAKDLIYEDGAFAQHSLNYHRLMLHDYLWALRLGEIHGAEFSAQLKARFERAAQFLYQLQDDQSGCVPNYGHNDGALVLPLNNCDYRDFRPVIQAARHLTRRTRIYEAGPWDEDLLWLFGEPALSAPRERLGRTDLVAPEGGYHTLRSADGFAFVRCARFRHRPSHADLLHVDLWWRGQNVALDPGTYSYNAPAPWQSLFGSTAAHNTVTVDERDQMELVSRFLWLPWARGWERLRLQSPAGRLAYWEGEHDGYARLSAPVSHRRAVVRMAEVAWLVVDQLLSKHPHRYRLHWLFPDTPYDWDPQAGRICLHLPSGPYYVLAQASFGLESCHVTRAQETPPRGWRSQSYGSREPALSLALAAQGASVWFLTCFSEASAAPSWNGSEFRLQAKEWALAGSLQPGRKSKSILGALDLSGATPDHLSLAA